MDTLGAHGDHASGARLACRAAGPRGGSGASRNDDAIRDRRHRRHLAALSWGQGVPGGSRSLAHGRGSRLESHAGKSAAGSRSGRPGGTWAGWFRIRAMCKEDGMTGRGVMRLAAVTLALMIVTASTSRAQVGKSLGVVDANTATEQ